MTGHSSDSERQPLQFCIGGMHCAACSSRIERVLDKLPGVDKASVNLATATAEVWPASDATGDIENRIIERVEKIGFSAAPVRDDDSARQYAARQQKLDAERSARLRRLVPMTLFSLPLLVLSMGHMAGMPLPDWLEPHVSPRAFILAQLLLTLPVIWLGRHFYVDGLLALFRRAPNMDSLVAVGTGTAFIYSLIGSVSGLLGNEPVARAMDLYYESCAVLLTMIEFGQFLEFNAKRKAGDAMGALLSLAPETALLLDSGGNPVQVPVSTLKPGDHLLVRPGSRIPVDGKILDGASAVDLSLLTGESIPVPVSPGDDLVAGSVNGEGSMVMEAVAVGTQTRLARIIRLVRDAQGAKAPIARLADRASYFFVPAVMVFALVASAIWLVFSSEPVSVALGIFVAVLVMACPCAMGLATPMSIMVGTGRGAQMGILIKNGAALEQTGQITALCVDKTGTLTTGHPELTELILLEPGQDKAFSRNELLGMAGSLERRSEHPLGLAIIRAAEKVNAPTGNVDNVMIRPGLGISGNVHLGGSAYSVAIGNESFMREKGIALPHTLGARLETLGEAGQTPLLLACSAGDQPPQVAAILALSDQLRPESPAVVDKLRKMGIRVIMLTGDNVRTASAIARQAGISEVRADLLPAQKAEFVADLQKSGLVVGMVGDGLNDAPALAQADVGMAVGSGVDVSAEAGDIVLMRHGMLAVLGALALSRATMRNIRENLGWAFGYNILGLPVAAGLLYAFGGPLLSPMIAGTAMALSSFSVVTNALRLRWFKTTLDAEKAWMA